MINKAPFIILNDPERAVAPITTMLKRGPVVLLCGCADVTRCHRGVAAAFLAERLEAEVMHLPSPERTRRPGDQLRLPGWE